MSKKGALAGFEAIMWVPRAILVVVAALVLIFVFGSFIITVIDVKEAHSLLLADHLFYDKNGLAYFDEDISRVYPGKIDLNKFNDALLKQSIIMNNPYLMAANITYNNKWLVYYKKEQYERWLPRVGFAGAGGSYEFLIAKTALNNLFLGSSSLLFHTLIPNIVT